MLETPSITALSTTTSQPAGVVQPTSASQVPAHELEVFYDGDCPLCLREITMLKRLDRRKRILFTDIAAPEFSPEAHGRSMDELMAELHARLPGGEWLSGMEVFRRLYSAVGFGWLVAPTRLPLISQVCDWGYRVFARNRLKLTGRCSGTCEIPRPARH